MTNIVFDQEIPSKYHGNRHVVVTQTDPITFEFSITERFGYTKSNVLFQNGIPRWATNNRIPPQSSIVEYGINLLPGFDQELTDRTREEEDSAFIAEYKKQRLADGISDEERFEARAAHGPGQTLVNVFTGQKFTT